MSDHWLAIDQGTTSSRAIVFDSQLRPVAMAQQEFAQHFPASGWVEHDGEAIWQSVLAVCRQALRNASIDAAAIRAIGIANQRETTLIWERASGRPIHNAIVWQDRRTADLCRQLHSDPFEQLLQQRTGLLLDPYFCATKIRWLLDNVEGARQRAERGELAFGTIDSWLIWNLTGGTRHLTDATNAARTLLFDIHRQCWDDELLRRFDIPGSLLPEVRDSAADFGSTAAALLGHAVPICGVAGDQQAALFGQACFEPGMAKCTYGTGAFAVANTGAVALQSRNRLLTTVAWRLQGRVSYALEGSIFVAGAAIQWLRDALKLFPAAADSEALARAAGVQSSVYLVPAFTGMGAPHWDPDARGALVGLTRDSGIAEITAAALQAVGHQTRDLLAAMAADGIEPQLLRVDGGMVVNDWAMQYLADLVQRPVERPRVAETTALGAAMLAMLQCGAASLAELAGYWQTQRKFEPSMQAVAADTLHAGWQRAVAAVRRVGG
jgi:glycerol kinase